MYIMKYPTEGHKIRIINIIYVIHKRISFSISIYDLIFLIICINFIYLKIKFEKGKSRRNKNIEKVHNFSPKHKAHVKYLKKKKNKKSKVAENICVGKFN